MHDFPPLRPARRTARTTTAAGLHGEYKVPGGKLVVVDFDVVGGHFATFPSAVTSSWNLMKHCWTSTAP